MEFFFFPQRGTGTKMFKLNFFFSPLQRSKISPLCSQRMWGRESRLSGPLFGL